MCVVIVIVFKIKCLNLGGKKLVVTSLSVISTAVPPEGRGMCLSLD